MRPLTIMTGASALALSAVLGAAFATPAHAASIGIRGQGATLPAGLYAAWFDPSFKKGFAFSYNAPLERSGGAPIPARTGSSAGKSAFETHEFNAGKQPDGVTDLPPDVSKSSRENISFGGSDAILSTTDLDAYEFARWGDPIQVPTVGTAVTISYNPNKQRQNRTGPTGLVNSKGEQENGPIIYLSRASYCGIFTGKIKTWNHPRIVADNNGFPSKQPIKVVVRSDGSGTTEIFTRHLDTVCDGSQAAGGYTFPDTRPAGDNGPATGTTLFDWASIIDSDRLILGPGNGGVATAMAANRYSIGYLSPDYTNIVENPNTSASPLPVPANLQNQYDIDNDVDVAGHSPAWKNIKEAQQGISAPSASDDAIAWGRMLNLQDPQSNNPTAKKAFPINGFTFMNFYTCYRSKQVSGVKALTNYFTNPSKKAEADIKAKAANFSPLGNALKQAVRERADSIRPGPANGVCTL